MASTEPEGDLVTGPPAIDPQTLPQTLKLGPTTLSHGITLRPLALSHAQDLYTNLCGPSNYNFYKYLPAGPFHDIEAFTSHLKSMLDGSFYYPFSIFSSDPSHLSNQNPNATKTREEEGEKGEGTPISIICLLNISPPNRSVEIGYVLFSSSLQRTTAGTAAVYLLMKFCFEELHYQRVEWKCNDRNKPSERAALRLGFRFEGIFRKHMVVKGRRRDSAWFSVIDDEWVLQGKGGVRRGLEGWLVGENFDEGGGQRRKLEEVRGGE